MRSNFLRLTAVLLLLTLGACASAPPTPKDWLSEPDMVPVDPRGGWIAIKPAKGSGLAPLTGELLALNSRRVWVNQNDVIRDIALENVSSMKLVYYDSHAGELIGLTVLGTVSTLSTGFYLVLGAPIWMLAGGGTANQRAKDPLVDADREEWKELLPYARFPQGLPDGFASGMRLVALEPGWRSPDQLLSPAEPAPDSLAVALVTEPVRPPMKYWYNVGVGPGFTDEFTGFGFEGTIGFASDWFAGAARFMAVERKESEFYDAGFAYDAAMLLGVQMESGETHVVLGIGPAAWAARFEDLKDFDLGWGAQINVMRTWNSGFQLGTVFAYNYNDFQSFYTLCLAVGHGSR